VPGRAVSAPVTRRSVLRGAGLLAGTAVLGGCSDRAASSARSDRAPITLTDQRGQRVELPHAAERVVTIPMPAASILIAVDQSAEHVVGMQDASWAAIQDGILGEFFPAARGIPHDVADNTFVPNVESVLALEPDLVVQWGDGGSDLTAPLENAGLTVVGLSYGTQDDVDAWITLFATALGRPDRGEALGGYISDALSRIRSSRPSPSDAPPSILYFNRFADELKVAGAGTYNDDYISLVGGENPASGPGGAAGEGMVGVDPEQVLAWDPDVVLLGNFDAALPSDLYDSRVWRGLSAVRNRRVYKVPLGGYRWDPPSHESPLMWRWLSMVAFPDRQDEQERFDLRSEVVRSYRLFYGHEPTDEQMDAVLALAANDGSSAYEQFHAG
jgi:iron complex transport system substrate-binding protein